MDTAARDNVFAALLADGVELPWGFEPYSWHWFPGSGLSAVAKTSKLHLRPEGGDEYGASLCGLSHRYARTGGPRRLKCRENHGTSDQEWAAKEGGACVRCFLLALETIHVLTLRSHRTGVSNRYGRGAGGSGGVNTHGRCSCGWEWRTNGTKREAEQGWRAHLRDVCFEPQFVVTSVETGEEVRRGTNSEAATALGPGGYDAVGWDVLVKDPTAEVIVKYGGRRDDLMLRVRVEPDGPYLPGGDPRGR